MLQINEFCGHSTKEITTQPSVCISIWNAQPQRLLPYYVQLQKLQKKFELRLSISFFCHSFYSETDSIFIVYIIIITIIWIETHCVILCKLRIQQQQRKKCSSICWEYVFHVNGCTSIGCVFFLFILCWSSRIFFPRWSRLLEFQHPLNKCSVVEVCKRLSPYKMLCVRLIPSLFGFYLLFFTVICGIICFVNCVVQKCGEA